MFWKLLLSFAALSAATILLLAALFSRAYESRLEGELDHRLRATAVTVGKLLSDRWPTDAEEQIQTLVRQTGQTVGVRVTLIDMNGRVVADSYLPDATAVQKMESHHDRPEFMEARRTGTGSARRLSPTMGERMRYQAVRIDSGAQPLGVVRTSLPTREIDAQVAALSRWIWIVSGLTAAAAMGVACWIVVRLTEPLRSLASAAEAILAGQYEYRLPVNPPANDEVGALARALGEVRNRLAHGERQLRSSSQTQETVLEGMTECVVAVDRGERILFANAAAGRSLGFNSRRVEGLTLLEAVRSHELRDAMQKALRSRQLHNCEINWRSGGRRTFDVLAAPLPGDPPPGVVIVLRDISELKRLEQVRQQFIANVSHELKTPLSSIKAYTETLLSGARNDPEHCERFLTQIDQQASRLHQLIQDMLSLARIEAGQAALELADIPVARVLRRSIADQEPHAVAAAIVLENQATDADLIVHADEDGLRQILNNLIDNAIKYTPAGGRVTIHGRRDESMAVIEVADTGLGMAPEHHSRVFERFYRVDRARSRELGGTGLGLAIVKHLCQAMGGAVSVHSQLNQGATFVVRLPLAGPAGTRIST